MVALFHFIHFTGPDGPLVNSQSALDISVFGAQGVELFYMISGFIIPWSLYHSSYKIQDYFRYLSKRLIRLMPPYLITILLIVGVGYFLSTYIWGTTFDLPIKQILVNVFFLADLFPSLDWINPIFATLEVELQFYLLIGLLFPIIMRNSWAATLVIGGMLVAGIFTRDLDTVFINSPYFCLGLIVFLWKEKKYPVHLLFLTLLIQYVLFTYFDWKDSLISLIGLGLMMWLPQNLRFLNFTGKISYSFYLMHGLCGGQFLYFTHDTWLWKNLPWLMIIFALALSWIGAFILYQLIEKTSLKFSQRIKYSRNLPAKM